MSENDKCREPDVRQQVSLIYPNHKSILFLDGESAMELDGQQVVFDKKLQQLINRITKQRKSMFSKEFF